MAIRNTKVIDFHIHYSPKALIQEKLNTLKSPDEKRVSYVQGIPSYTTHNGLHDFNKHIEMMDFSGIDIAVISSGEGMGDELEKCKVVNDSLHKAMKTYNGRIIGMAHAPALGGPAALAEMERGIKHLGLKGVAIPSTVQGKGLDHKDLWPFYEKVQQLGTFLFVHPALATPTLGFQGFDAYDLYRTVGREFDLVLATMRLICGGVLDDFPELKVIVSHLSGGISALLGRIKSYQHKDFWGLANDPIHGRTAKEAFEYYISNRLYFDTGGHIGDMTAVKSALLNIPSSQLLFGTDYPQEIRTKEEIRAFVQNIDQLPISEEERNGILGNNGYHLLGL